MFNARELGGRRMEIAGRFHELQLLTTAELIAATNERWGALALSIDMALLYALRRQFELERHSASRNPPGEYGERATFEGWLRERLLDVVHGDTMMADMEAWTGD